MEKPEILTPDFRQRHLSNITSALGGLWHRRLYTDLTLVSGGGKYVRCHRVVLASASPYFHSRLFNGKRESSTDKIFVRDVSGDTLAEVLEFVYSGQCRLREDNAEELLRAATIFQLLSLRDMCDFFLKDCVQPKNALHLYKVAHATRSPLLEDKAREVIGVNLRQLCRTRLFRQLHHQELISISAHHNDSSTLTEEMVYDAVTAWIKVDKVRRKPALGEILRSVPLSPTHQENLRQLVDEDVFQEDQTNNIQKTQQTLQTKETIKNSQAREEIDTPAAKPTPRTPHENYRPLVEEMVLKEDDANTQKNQASLQRNETTVDSEDAEVATPPEAKPKPRNKQVEQVLVTVGGVEVDGGRYRRSQRIQVFHPSLESWTQLGPPLPLTSDSGAAYCTQQGNDIFVTGVGDARKGLVKYQADKNRWRVLAPMSTGRRGHTMVAQGNYLYVLGGVTLSYDSSQPSNQQKTPTATDVVECYDILNNTWKIAGSLAQAVWGASAVVFKNKIHVFGGFQDDRVKPTSFVQKFCPVSKTSRVSSQLPFPIALSQAVFVDSGEVLLMGPSGTILTTTDCWRFKVVLSIPGFRRALFGMTTHEGRVYVVGGRRGPTVHDDVVEVDVGCGTVTQMSERIMPRPVWGCGFFTLSVDTALLIGEDRVIDSAHVPEDDPGKLKD